MPRRALITLLACLVLLVAAVAARWLVGAGAVLPGSGDHDQLLRQLSEIKRLRIGMGAGVGASLAVAGVFLQCLLRNPLASPDLMGLGTGAGLGVTIAAYAAFVAGDAVAPEGASATASLAGACASLAVVYTLSQRRGLIDPVSLVLVGVVISIMCSAGILFFEHLLPDRGRAVARWLLGALDDDASATSVWTVGLLAAGATAVGAALGPWLDASTLSEDEARSVGVRLGPLRGLLFALAGVLTAGAVTLAGPVGFVGLVCPHMVRLAGGPSHRGLVAGSALAGAALVVAADALVKAIDLGAGRLPIGVLTSIVGGPVLILMIRQHQRAGF
jgi:iron complex transport system permease protein